MKIEKNIPMPSDRPYSQDRYPSKYPFKVMEVGDSVVFPDQNGNGKAATAAKVYGHRSGKHFTSRKVDGGVRIWRDK